MFRVLIDTKRLILAGGALGLAAVIGWGSFAYVAVTSSHRVAALSAERDAAIGERQQLLDKAGQLAGLEAKANLARAEYSRAMQGLADAKAKTAAAQQELAPVARRVEAPTDRVSQTGSIRQPEPPKRPTR